MCDISLDNSTSPRKTHFMKLIIKKSVRNETRNICFFVTKNGLNNRFHEVDLQNKNQEYRK